MRPVLFVFVFALLCIPSATRHQQPNPNSRDAFATQLFRSLLNQLNKQPVPTSVVLISPASVQKLLAVFYNISSYEYMRPLARDMGMHDAFTLLRESIEMTAARARARLLRQSKDQVNAGMMAYFILPYHVLEFFAKDFDELGSDITAQNYFVYDGGYEIDKRFQYSAQDYFNIAVLPKHQPVVTGLLHDFGFTTHGLEIYSFVKFHAFLGEQFRNVQDLRYARGYFRYADKVKIGHQFIHCKIVELPLYGTKSRRASMLLIMPGKHMQMTALESKILSGNLRSFKDISKQLRFHKVAVRMPSLKFLSKINLGKYIKEMSWIRLHKLFHLELHYRGMFDPPFNRRIQVQRYVQSINMQLHVLGGNAPLSEYMNPLRFFNASKTFDCATSQFLFIVKSADVIYFMGRHRRGSVKDRAHSGQF
ncbi:uncharacterized protein LOC115624522 [Scaptodrosophila lebanonensis]|uniref:Uncharacterized protein LOC115624522 n=1 Tax=Drosophila lebanonensis TaxID=7225 RepID=A0A6J2TI77_DROLE|nr:uncharacterized protein LOC115624522 [Scaptodrosophila lebanonensis]